MSERLAETLLAQAATLRAQADALAGQALTLEQLASVARSEAHGAGEELLDLPALQQRYGLGRRAVLAAEARGELELRRASRGRILVPRAAVEVYVTAKGRALSKLTTIGSDWQDESSDRALDEWERQCDRQLSSLKRVGGR